MESKVKELVEKLTHRIHWLDGLNIHTQDKELFKDCKFELERLEAENEKLKSLVKLGWELSTWAGCINWRGNKNQKGWLDDLKEKIEGYQKLYKQLDEN
jgi:hypothetical protein